MEPHPTYGMWVAGCSHSETEDGVPNLGALCPGKQVRGMLERLCDVCGRTIGRNAFFMGGVESLAEGGGYRELPVHRECGVYAGQVCPGLITGARRDHIRVAKCRTYTMQPSYTTGWDPVTDRPEDRRFDSFDDPRLALMHAMGVRSVLTMVWAVPDNPQVWSLDEWLTLNREKVA
jgi:hypothetical protein